MTVSEAAIVVASANPHKVSEIRTLLTGWTLVGRPSEVPKVEENADTLEGNARLKALALREATGLASVADDTGLEVDVLDGLPGVRSARYAGEAATDADNVEKLLGALAEVPEKLRVARFHTVALLALSDGTELIGNGTVEGSITNEPRGTEGFGYDAVFVPLEGDGRTFAEMTADEKHEISHRGRAFRNLREQA